MDPRLIVLARTLFNARAHVLAKLADFQPESATGTDLEKILNCLISDWEVAGSQGIKVDAIEHTLKRQGFLPADVHWTEFKKIKAALRLAVELAQQQAAS